MIVRILGEGQYRLPDAEIDHINSLDAELERALGGDGDFRAALGALLAQVRSVGEELPDESLETSDVVLPSSDASADEVREMLTDEGLIPG
jgi:hypothetical protein